LPARLGGLGLVNPVTNAQNEYKASCKVTVPLSQQIVSQDASSHTNIDTNQLKSSLKWSKRERQSLQFQAV
jgi:hypothetical protein